MQTLADIGEDELIRRLVSDLKFDKSVIAGPGDDCAIVSPPAAGRVLLLKTDTVVEGVHFTADTQAKLVGRKAMARVISDFAAMAAKPEHALITLIAPPQTAVRRVIGVYEGLRGIAEQYGVQIVGGETSRGQQLIITVSLTGTAGAGVCVGRGNGEVGDKLFVTGRLGGSIRGKHLRFEPRMAEAHWLARRFKPHAMMDISDGLAKDLPRLAAACGLGFSVDMDKLPCTRGCSPAQAWTDGEDYELLFAVGAKAEKKLTAAWQKAFPSLPLSCIGELTADAANGAGRGGWDHFLVRPNE